LRWYNAIFVLHHNDIVEEIAALHQGQIDAVDQYISEGQKMPPHRWRVRFSDGREPLFQYFVRQEDLPLIRCPHTRSRRIFEEEFSRECNGRLFTPMIWLGEPRRHDEAQRSPKKSANEGHLKTGQKE